MRIRWLANAGVLVQAAGASVAVDALHGKVPRFSATPPDLVRRIVEGERPFSRIDLALVTHQHSDHWDARLVLQMLCQHSETTLVSPVLPKGGPADRMVRITGEQGTILLPHLRIRYMRVDHEGEVFSHIPNYAYRIHMGDESFIVTGDAAIDKTAEAVLALSEEAAADAVFVDFPLLTLSSGRKALKSLPARNIFVFHLPYEEDDEDGFRDSAKKARERTGTPVTLLLERGQQEDA